MVEKKAHLHEALHNALHKAKGKRALVVGDFMLDTYIFGKAGRISPEAPVPVVLGESEKALPGGAGNVALNLLSLGVVPLVLGRTGKDSAGELLRGLLEGSDIDTTALIVDEGYVTSHKMRIIAQNQQVVRLDREKSTPLSFAAENRVKALFPTLLEKIDIIVVSDYGKGFVTPTLFSTLAQEAKKRSIPLLVDPKGFDYTKYRGATLIKPNLREAYEAAGLCLDRPIDEVAANLFAKTAIETLLITRSEKGITLFHQLATRISRKDFPTQAKEIKDVTGAGDTVLSSLTLAILAGYSMEEGCLVANAAASIALEHVGCVQVSLQELVHRLEEREVSKKIFRDDDLLRLQRFIDKSAVSILKVRPEEKLTLELHRKICEHKENNERLLLHFEEEPREEGLIEALASFAEVDFLYIGKATPNL